jgi:hypothetical protein
VSARKVIVVVCGRHGERVGTDIRLSGLTISAESRGSLPFKGPPSVFIHATTQIFIECLGLATEPRETFSSVPHHSGSPRTGHGFERTVTFDEDMKGCGRADIILAFGGCVEIDRSNSEAQCWARS